MLQEKFQDSQEFFGNHRFFEFKRVWEHFWWVSLGGKMPRGNRKVFQNLDLKKIISIHFLIIDQLRKTRHHIYIRV